MTFVLKFVGKLFYETLFDMVIQEAKGPMSGCLGSAVELFDAQD